MVLYDATEKPLNQTALVIKAGTDKMVYMIKQYKDLRHTIEQLGWGMRLDGVDEISHEDCELQTGTCKTAKEIILKRCPWYYEYKELFCNHPGVNPPILVESEQPTRRDGQIVNDFELGGYDKDLQEEESPSPDSGGLSDQNGEEDVVQENEDESDFSSLHSVLLQIVQDNQHATRNQTKNTAVSSNNEV